MLPASLTSGAAGLGLDLGLDLGGAAVDAISAGGGGTQVEAAVDAISGHASGQVPGLG